MFPKRASVKHMLAATLRQISGALERLAPPPLSPPDLGTAEAFLWQAIPRGLEPIAAVNRVALDLLKGIDRQRTILLDNTRRFAQGLPANNALLWGARGTGKSALVKAVHAVIARENPLILVEIHREDLLTLPSLLGLLACSPRRCLLFCDDLSFEIDDQSYKSLKTALEGGVQGQPDTILFYATSNRRHLIPRDMIENVQANALLPGEVSDEKISLSDRFGLWLGFHPIDQVTYLEIVQGYAQAFALPVTPEQLSSEAREWAMTRGTRSGRVAWQFIQDLAGRLGCHLPLP